MELNDKISQFNDLKDTLKECEKEKEQTIGRLKELLESLKEKFECNSYEEGKELSKKFLVELDKLEKLYLTEIENFKKKFDKKVKSE